MLARSFVALFVGIAVLTAPTVSRTRLFCRATGIEIPPSACPDETNATSHELLAERCCEHRVEAPLGVAKPEAPSKADGTLPALAVELHWLVQLSSSPPPCRDTPPPSRRPLSATRILLI